MKLKTAIPVVIIFLFISTAIAESDSIFYASSLLLDVNMHSDFTLIEKNSAGRIDYVLVNFYFFPENSNSQEVISLETTPESTRTDDAIKIKIENPSFGKHEYSIRSEIRTYNQFETVKEKIPFPIKSLDPSLMQYIKPTDKIDINQNILNLANDIAKGEDDLYNVVFSLAAWTKENINYSITTQTAEASQKASWVLENRYGVCDELTNLYIAMLRSLGIPARFVSGISYTNSKLFKESWGLHGWAEVYFPGYGWVSIDPTYGQYGQLDAGHIKLRDSFDSDKSSSKFEWQGVNVNLETGIIKTNVNVLEQGNNITGPLDITIIPLANEVAFGSYNLIEAKLRNNRNYYVGFELGLNRPEEIITIEDLKYVLLKPNEEKSVYWIIQVSPSLSKNYIYTFPIEVFSTLGDRGEGSFKSVSSSINYNAFQIESLLGQFVEKDQKVYSKNIEIDCPVPGEVYANITFALGCSIKNTGNILLKDVKICLNDLKCVYEDLGINQEKQAWFNSTIYRTGDQEVEISAKNKDINSFKLIRLIVSDEPRFTIQKVSYPDELDYGPDFSINFEAWKESLSNPKNITLKVTFNDRETEWKFGEADSNRVFSVNLDKSMINPDKNLFWINLTYHNGKNDEFSESYVKELKTKPFSFFIKIQIYLNKFSRSVDRFFSGLGKK